MNYQIGDMLSYFDGLKTSVCVIIDDFDTEYRIQWVKDEDNIQLMNYVKKPMVNEFWGWTKVS